MQKQMKNDYTHIILHQFNKVSFDYEYVDLITTLTVSSELEKDETFNNLHSFTSCEERNQQSSNKRFPLLSDSKINYNITFNKSIDYQQMLSSKQDN